MLENNNKRYVKNILFLLEFNKKNTQLRHT